MHGPLNVKFVNAQQEKQTYQYKNTEEKLYKTNAAILYNKICRKIWEIVHLVGFYYKNVSRCKFL